MTWNTTFDEQFAGIGHFQLYPELYPWVGQNFDCHSPRILVLGESHYLERDNNYHHNAEAWYTGVSVQGERSLAWANTRRIIDRGLRNNWKEKSKTIYRNLEAAAVEAGVGVSTLASPFHSIAFMNYFQRPAQVSGESIVVTELDRSYSALVLNSVLEILRPQIVVFCSILAWKAARHSISRNRDVRIAFTTHPANRWWNTRMRKYKGRSGKELFIDALLAGKHI